MPDPLAGRLNPGHLMDVIYTRDQWLPRVDIYRRTDRGLELRERRRTIHSIGSP